MPTHWWPFERIPTTEPILFWQAVGPQAQGVAVAEIFLATTGNLGLGSEVPCQAPDVFFFFFFWYCLDTGEGCGGSVGVLPSQRPWSDGICHCELLSRAVPSSVLSYVCLRCHLCFVLVHVLSPPMYRHWLYLLLCLDSQTCFHFTL